MHQIICDRCEQNAGEGFSEMEVGTPPSFPMRMTLPRTEEAAANKFRVRKTYDLCPECLTSLEEWFKIVKQPV